MGRHAGKVILVDAMLDALGVEASIENQRNTLVEDGVELAQIMRGRRRMGEASDQPHFKLLRTTWMTKVAKLKASMGHQRAAIFRSKGSSHDKVEAN